METRRTFCRFCFARCGIEADIEGDQLLAVRGDTRNPMSGGFTCIKGRCLPEQHASPDRLLRSQKRTAEGGFEPIASEQAIDEIAAQLKQIIDRDGPRAVAIYNGTAAFQNALAIPITRGWLAGLGSPSYYSSVTIDQPAKIVAPQRHGSFLSGTQSFETSDVWMAIGKNPLVSMFGGTAGFPSFNPHRRLQDARRRGLSLIVVDPRRSQLAKMADLHLPVRPGEDPTLLSGLIRVILEEGLYDAEFCELHTEGLEALREAVAGFTPEYVERRARVAADQVVEAARLFARGPRGAASTGTGANMAPRPNLTEHLVHCLNSLCGRYRRTGERVENPGTLTAPFPKKEQANAPVDGWAMGPQSRIRGLGQIAGELPTAALAEEITTPGEGRVRALIVVGGNPIVAWPDQRRTREALEDLELLVCIDIWMGQTTRFADYVIAPKLPLEHADITDGMDTWFPEAYAQYTPPVIDPPAGSDVICEWEFFWGLAHRLGTNIVLSGGPIDIEEKPLEEDLLDSLTTHARVPLSEVRKHESGALFPAPDALVAPADPDCTARLHFAPTDIAAELGEVFAEELVEGGGYRPGERFAFRLIGRRLREVANSAGQQLPTLRAKQATNPLFVGPEDLAALGLSPGDVVEIRAASDCIAGVVELDTGLPPGVVSMSHAWGDVPDAEGDVREIGGCTARLVDSNAEYDPISGIPRMSAIPVDLRPIEGGRART